MSKWSAPLSTTTMRWPVALLVDWLCAAVTCTVAHQASPLLELQPPPPTYMTAALLQRRWALVTKDLPALIAPGGQAQIPVQAPTMTRWPQAFKPWWTKPLVTTRLTKLGVHSRQAKPPSSYFGETGVSKLLRLCQVATEDQLPTLWKKLAATTKSDGHLISKSSSTKLHKPWGTTQLLYPSIQALSSRSEVCSLS